MVPCQLVVCSVEGESHQSQSLKFATRKDCLQNVFGESANNFGEFANCFGEIANYFGEIAIFREIAKCLVKLLNVLVKLQIITTLSTQCGRLCLYVVGFHLVVDLQLV